jgi:SpoVK/Ycf46/Vps4 family AAA+-type ATPase
VFVSAATNRPNALDEALRRPGRLDAEVEVGVPTVATRRAILATVLGGVRHAVPPAAVAAVAAGMHGFVGADVAHAVREAGMPPSRNHTEKTHCRGPASSPIRAILRPMRHGHWGGGRGREGSHLESTPHHRLRGRGMHRRTRRAIERLRQTMNEFKGDVQSQLVFAVKRLKTSRGMYTQAGTLMDFRRFSFP